MNDLARQSLDRSRQAARVHCRLSLTPIFIEGGSAPGDPTPTGDD